MMFGKLLRYDLRSCFKKLGGLWIGAAIMFVINSLVFNLVEYNDSAAGVMLYMASGAIQSLTSMAVVIMSFVFIITRFYKGMTGSEGYLMFTLPVKTESLILSKLTSAIIVQLISGAVASIPSVISLIFGAADYMEMSQLYSELYAEMQAEVYAEMGINLAGIMALMLPIAIVGSIEQIMRIYFSIAMGHRAKKHRVVWSIVAYMVTNYAISAIAVILMTGTLISCIATDSMDSMTSIYWIEAVILVGMAALTLVEFFITRRIFSKNLNLE